MFECFRAVELCVKCLTKRDKVWVNELMLIMLKTVLLFPKAVDFSLPMHSFGFLNKKKKGGGGGHGEATNEVLCPFFLYLFIYCYLL